MNSTKPSHIVRHNVVHIKELKKMDMMIYKLVITFPHHLLTQAAGGAMGVEGPRETRSNIRL